MKKHVLSAILASLMLVPALAACSEDVQQTPDTTAADTTVETDPPETELSDDLEKMDYKGQSFTFLSSDVATSQHAVTVYLEESADVLNNAFYLRTQAVAEKYNIRFTDDVLGSNSAKTMEMFQQSVSAGDKAYDVGMLHDRRAFAVVSEGYFMDIDKLPNVNLEKPYWNQSVNEAIRMTDETYLAYGSMVLSLYDMTHVLLFNKNMQENLKLDDPYKLVQDGAWTLDKMKEMGLAARLDNGDGVWDKADTYGIVGGYNAVMYNFLTAALTRTMEADGQGNVRVHLLTNPRIEEAFTKVMDIFWDPGFWYTKSNNSNDYYTKDTFFQTNQSLFADHTFFSMIQLRDMEADFGAIPFPKLDASQEEYGTMVEAGARVLTVPVTTRTPALTGAVIETMNFLSYRDVIPAYYEVVLKQKVSRDSESAQMLDLILNSIHYDLGATMFNDQVKDGIFRNLIRDNKREYVSTVTAQLPKIESAIVNAGGKAMLTE